MDKDDYARSEAWILEMKLQRRAEHVDILLGANHLLKKQLHAANKKIYEQNKELTRQAAEHKEFQDDLQKLFE